MSCHAIEFDVCWVSDMLSTARGYVSFFYDTGLLRFPSCYPDYTSYTCIAIPIHAIERYIGLKMPYPFEPKFSDACAYYLNARIMIRLKYKKS